MGPMSYEIERMDLAEVEATIDWAAAEGWNPGLHDAECFHAIDADGFFMGVLDGRAIARGAALNYDANFSFGGLYIVDPAYRGQGYGLKLFEAMRDHVGTRNNGIDGVVEMQEKYKQMGYRFAHRDVRYRFTPERPREVALALQPLAALPFSAVAEYDRRHFCAPRETFLRRWITQPGAVSLGAPEGERLRGYGVMRQCREGHKIGPLFAEAPEIAEALFDALCSEAWGEPVSIDVPEPNRAATALVQGRGLEPVFECARMYLKGDPGLPLSRIYGMTTLEAG
jgi:GNAT superfamily N-acetyltransferase